MTKLSLVCGMVAVLSCTAFASPTRLAGSVAFSPDSKTVAVGGFQQISLMDAVSGRPGATLTGLAGAVTAIAYSADGRWVAAAGGLPGRKGEIRLWKTPVSGSSPTLLFEAHTDAIYDIAFSPDSKRIVAVSYDHQVSVWNLAPAAKPLFLKDHTDAVYAVAWNPTGELIASAAGDRTVKIWDAKSGKRLYTLSEASGEVFGIAFSPDGKMLASGGADKTLRTYRLDRKGGVLVKAALTHEAPLLRVLYAADGKTILTAGEDRAVKRWDSATLAERRVYAKQPDIPNGIAMSRDLRYLVVGRHDGSVGVYNAETGKLVRQSVARAKLPSLTEMPTTSTVPGRKLGDSKVRKDPGTGGATLFAASLSAMLPYGVQRGRPSTFMLYGSRINPATGVYFDDPEITGKLSSTQDSNPGALRVDAMIGPKVRIGVHRVYVQTAAGTTGSVTYAVGDWPEVAEVKPNATPESAQKMIFPSTLTGVLDQPGSAAHFRFEAAAGQELVFEVIAQAIRSRLQPVLTLLDSRGNALAEAQVQPGRQDVLLGHRFEVAGTYTLRLRDYEGAGGSDVYFRINAGAFPVVIETFPIGVRRGATTEVQIRGYNLGGIRSVQVSASADAAFGAQIPVELQTAYGPLISTRRVVVTGEPQAIANNANFSVSSAQRVPNPVAIDGEFRLSSGDGGPFHYYRFGAKKGQSLVLDVVARRVGSRLDSEIEVLDATGKSIERAVVRAVAQTEMTLNDRTSQGQAFRIVAWDGFHVTDYLMFGREIVQISELPRGPDADINIRGFRGQRYTFLGTTPEYHSVASPVFKVEMHPAGSKFSPNGYPLVSIPYRNDDGTILHGKDSYLEFVAPADGDYIVRIGDARGQTIDGAKYRLSIREPRPDYRIVMSPEHPNLPAGGSVSVQVECERFDGFNGPIKVWVEGLSDGFAVTKGLIEAGETSTNLLIMAAPGTKTPAADKPFRIVAKARAGELDLVRTIEPDNGRRLITVMGNPDLKATTNVREIVIRPGGEARIEIEVERLGNFGARVPIEVRNLPFGVRVMDIGLNGILVTEKDTSRVISFYCEPFVAPMERPIYLFANVEGGVANAALPVMLKVEPMGRPSRKPSKIVTTRLTLPKK